MVVHFSISIYSTARSNKVTVTLGFQELPQLEADYGKVGMQKIITTCGNIFMGAARNKETLEWVQNDVLGKAKQTSRSISINDNKVSTTISEKMDYLVPAAKIADIRLPGPFPSTTTRYRPPSPRRWTTWCLPPRLRI